MWYFKFFIKNFSLGFWTGSQGVHEFTTSGNFVKNMEWHSCSGVQHLHIWSAAGEYMLYSCPPCEVTFSTQPSPWQSLLVEYLLYTLPDTNNLGSPALTMPSEDESTDVGSLAPSLLDVGDLDSYNLFCEQDYCSISCKLCKETKVRLYICNCYW